MEDEAKTKNFNTILHLGHAEWRMVQRCFADGTGTILGMNVVLSASTCTD